MNIAIIDDGVNSKYYLPTALVDNHEISDNLKIKKSAVNRGPGHATTCAAIINKYLKNIKIISIKILDGHISKGHINQLAVALDYCIKENIKLINLSLGSTNYSDYGVIRDKITKIIKNGGLIISAVNNQNKFSIPACMSGVFGVISEKTKSKYLRDAFYTKGAHILRNYKGELEMTQESNSYAVAYTTALVHKIITTDDKINYFNLHNYMSKMVWFFPYYYKEYFFNVSNTYIISCIELADVENPKDDRSMTLDELKEKLKEKNKLFNVILIDKRISKDITDFLYVKRDYIASLIFAFDPFNQSEYNKFLDNGMFIWSPLLQKKWLQHLLEKNKDVLLIEEIKCPIVGISSSDNPDTKFMDIRDYFRDNNYNAISISHKTNGIINGHFYLSARDFTEETLKLLYFEFSCDIILVQVLDKNYGFNFDLTIDLDDYRNYIFACEEIEKYFS